MEPQAYIVIGFIVLAIVVGIAHYIIQQKRIKELSSRCAAKNLRFNPNKDYSIAEQFPPFECLRRGDNQYAYNVISGDWQGRELLAFDYHYQTYSTDSKGRRHTQHHYFSAAILASPVPLKPLAIRPEGFFDKVSAFLGFDDIDFESIEFSRAFYVKSPDKRWAYDVIHPRMMEFLLAAPRFSLQFGPLQVLAHLDRTFTIPEFEAAAGTLQGILDRLPQYLVKQQAEQA